MTKAEVQRLVIEIGARHPVHALPLVVQVLAELVRRLPDDPPPLGGRAHVHKRFVPIDVTLPGREPS